MKIRIRWRDANFGESEQRIYRDTSPMDPQALPAPIGSVGAGVTEFIDANVVDQTTYYYRLSAIVDGQEYVDDEFEVLADDTLALYKGVWLISLAAWGDVRVEQYDPANTEHIAWPDRFGLTAGSILIDNYKKETTGRVDTGSVVGGVIPAGGPGYEFYLFGDNRSDYYSEAEMDLEFQDAQGTTLAVLRMARDGAYNQGLWYGTDFNSLTKAPQNGDGSYEMTAGWLRFDNDGFSFTVDEVNVGSRYNDSFRFDVPGGLADFAQINVPYTRAYEYETSGSGSRTYCYLELLRLRLLLGFGVSVDTQADQTTLTWEESVPSSVQQVRVYRDTSPLEPDNLPAPLTTLAGGVGTYVDTVPDGTVNYFYALGLVGPSGEQELSEVEMAVYSDLSSGLVAWYTMDAISGGVIADEMGAYPATLVNGTVVPGKAGDAVAFDPNAPTYAETSQRVPHGGTAITVAVWARLHNPTKSNGNWVLSQRSDPDDNAQQEWQFNNNSDSGEDSMAFWISDDSGAGYQFRHTTDTIPANEWVHWVGTYDGTDIKVYKDGVLLGSTRAPGVTLSSGAGAMTMGVRAILDPETAYTAGAPGNTDGDLDDVRLYDRALTATEVQALYGLHA
ncbi:LamG domain-containing protein [Halomonas alimentaria]|uniref:LamG-like jellyroll fold domain-containing protein n=1 Tax=Halomonas alimentaria TaxID=147248 RepID=A0A7X4W2S2_9GAMM|nr:LamG domain-containing protein [Halomonas alimentaria]NAW33254.1 hypothetical protein [Halomonas alimentaria]